MRALLLSGGIDSSAVCFWKRPDFALTVDYGQICAPGEVRAARAIANVLQVPHRIISVDLSAFGAGTMAGGVAGPLGQAPEWWPYRNQLLLTLAGMALVTEGLSELWIGSVNSDVHSDGRPEFLDRIDALMQMQEGSVRVVAPAIRMSTLELLVTSEFPADLLGLTFSCHVHEFPCGTCRGCEKHNGVLEEACRSNLQTSSAA